MHRFAAHNFRQTPAPTLRAGNPLAGVFNTWATAQTRYFFHQPVNNSILYKPCKLC